MNERQGPTRYRTIGEFASAFLASDPFSEPVPSPEAASALGASLAQRALDAQDFQIQWLPVESSITAQGAAL